MAVPVPVHHQIGAMVLFPMAFPLELRGEMAPRLFWADLLIAPLAVLSYAWAFVADSASKHSLQRTCVVDLLLAVKRSVTAAGEGFQPGEVWKAFQSPQHGWRARRAVHGCR